MAIYQSIFTKCQLSEPVRSAHFHQEMANRNRFTINMLMKDVAWKIFGCLNDHQPTAGINLDSIDNLALKGIEQILLL
jgi:hypothetical protein